MPERLEAGPGRPILEDDRGAVDETAGRDRPRARVLDRREDARRAASRRLETPGGPLARMAAGDENRERERPEAVPTGRTCSCDSTASGAVSEI